MKAANSEPFGAVGAPPAPSQERETGIVHLAEDNVLGIAILSQTSPFLLTVVGSMQTGGRGLGPAWAGFVQSRQLLQASVASGLSHVVWSNSPRPNTTSHASKK